MKRSIVFLAVTGFALLAFSDGAAAADKMYMTAKGQKVGVIKGGVTRKGHIDQMSVIALGQSVVGLMDPASGHPTGQMQHKPLLVKLALDRSAPLLINACVTNEDLPEVQIRFWRDIPNANGVNTERNVFTVLLTHANIASQTLVNPSAANPAGGSVLELTFTYQQIQWTWEDGGIIAIDNWQVPQY